MLKARLGNDFSIRRVWSDEDWVEKFSGKRMKRKMIQNLPKQKAKRERLPLKRPGQIFRCTWIGNKLAGRIQMLLHSDVVPMTAENFHYLCTHVKDLVSREAASTASSPSSCVRAVISQTTVAPGASALTRRNLMMKTLSSNTQDQKNSLAGEALSQERGQELLRRRL
uniref:peptidyl-prolyl cis-trans isomerase E isoform X1 n=1 Tax=Callithrix jacchus TaxID=9483 RepID=UPI0023DCF825|nr:peptidyl-prolyl cis-trans isomerase E isoform X1 [Callithrix jacchus]XP_054115159.1 peptidyl-prolyl cis-trans isomerase E isoform X1 [Callithrix jacchus]